ncbi:unnamed protein product [Pseudo-nitzschia multistriata]|uniref:Uncharacterized protein n=1 Tax=Pseudo-nitzschia multistriata TaxID=183589 RepID=A0A448YV43_9STRA|nr:unnamed protein product [Pseudo-nitzschia multistriata]
MNEKQDALFGIFMGVVSLVISSFFILVHYDFITCVEEGGWSELFSTALLIFAWVIALSIFTSSGMFISLELGGASFVNGKFQSHLTYLLGTLRSELIAMTSAANGGRTDRWNSFNHFGIRLLA